MKKKFKKYGEVVRALRLDRGLTQSELAEKIGVHSQFVSNAERQLCNLPKQNMKRFVKALSLTQSERLEILGAIVNDEINQARANWAKPLGLEP